MKKTYHGNLCKRHKTTRRYVVNGHCVACTAEQTAERKRLSAERQKKNKAAQMKPMKLEDWRVKMIGVRYDLEQTLKG